MTPCSAQGRRDAERNGTAMNHLGYCPYARSHRSTRRDAPRATLLVDLRSETMRRWTPTGGGSVGALNHVVVHSLDATAALGVERVTTDRTIRLVLDGRTTGGLHRHSGMSVDGVELVASDLSWSFGSGMTVRAPAQDLVLALCGRAVDVGAPLRV